jgi:hypothetical protein
MTQDHSRRRSVRRHILAGFAFSASAALFWMSAPVLAGSLVDPSTLQPVPPPGAVCRADGQQTICHTGLRFDLVNEPVFDLPCGTVYETSIDVRRGIRWYDADGKLTTRFVGQDAEGSLSLSPTGAGPTVTVTVHANWRNEYSPPGQDADSVPATSHGDGLTVRAPGVGVIAHIAGLDLPDGTHRGAIRGVDDPGPLCAALTR